MTERRTIHDRVLNASNVDELAEAYAEWADHYDADLVSDMGYQAHREVAETLRAVLDLEGAVVLDAGCGTGLVGVELQRLGYTAIDGLDYSRDMLDQAAEKRAYQTLQQADLMRPLALSTDRYDGVTCVGTFTLGHVGPQAFPELIRVTRPGGYLCFSVRSEAWENDNYASVLEELEGAGSWQVLEIRTATYIQEENSSCRICLCRVTGAD